MSKPPSERVQAFMDKYKIDADEVWEVRRGSGTYAIKHSALERVAAENGIKFGDPELITFNVGDKIAVMLVVGTAGERSEWSFGEAAPYNNQNPYPFAMAEKRAKDRVILKLLNAHGALYSDSEADEFAKRPNPHVTRPEDIVPTVEYDQYGEPVDNIPRGDERIERLPRAKAKTDYAEAQKELYAIKSVDELKRWGETNANRIESFPTDWQEIIRGQYVEHRDSLRNGKAA